MASARGRDDDDLRARVRARLAAQRRLVAALLRRRRQLQGSLFVRYGECGKPACACREGRRHGPYYVFSARSSGRGAFRHLAPGDARRARAQVARYREFRKGLSALQRVNVQLVALLRRYQKRQLRRGAADLGLAPAPGARP